MSSTEFVRPARPRTEAQDVELSPIDQWHAKARLWTVFCFETTPNTPQQTISAQLSKGLSYAITEFPEYAGAILPRNRNKPSNGFKKLRVGPDDGVNIRFKDLTTHPEYSSVTFAQLKAEYMPASKLKIAALFDEAETLSDDAACFIQANFVNGGVIILTVWHHAISDMTANSNFFRSWGHATAAFSKGEEPAIPECNPTSLNRDLGPGDGAARMKDVPLFDKLPKIFAGILTTAALKPPAAVPGTLTIFSTWHFSDAQLAQLKDFASSQNPKDPWITTNTALVALLWTCVTRARQLHSDEGMKRDIAYQVTDIRRRLPLHPSISKVFGLVGRALVLGAKAAKSGAAYQATDLRGRLNLPAGQNQQGNVSMLTMTKAKVSTWAKDDSLYPVAAALRESLGKQDLSMIKRYLGLLSKVKDISTMGPKLDLMGANMFVTNFAGKGHVDFMSADFGAEIGRPQFVRFPAEEAKVSGFAYILAPPAGSDGLDVMLMCTTDATERLKQDQKWTRWCTFKC